MRLPRECYQMQKTIETHLPHLSQPQLTGLVLWVCGAILAGSACQNAVASALSPWGRWNNLRQYLREWLYDGSDRTSPCQTQLDVTLCFAPLLRWVLAWWRSGRLALAIDPTLKGDQTTAIVISVLYRSCAIPVAWRIHKATQRGSRMDPTVELLKELAPAVPREMTVIVLCDRGISSPKLWQQIRSQGWHPGMRYRKNITFCADGGKRLPAQRFVSRPDTAWVGQGTAFSTPKAKRRCTLLVVWYVEQEEPWIILTDLPPKEVGVSWYALRFWIELGFKACPRPRPGGHQEPGLAVGQDPAHRPGTHLPTLAGAVGGDAAGPGLRHQGRRRPRPQDRPRQSADAAQDCGFQSPGPSEPSGAHRQRDPPRHRLAQAVAAQRTPLEPRLAAARTLAGTQAQPGGHPSCALVAAVTYPCQGGLTGVGKR